jgi:hypothetical protein
MVVSATSAREFDEHRRRIKKQTALGHVGSEKMEILLKGEM